MIINSQVYNLNAGDDNAAAQILARTITTLNLSNSDITSIGAYSLRECRALTKITLPDTITSLGAYAFYACSGLATLTLSSKLETIGTYAFYNCTNLATLTMPSVKTIASRAFYNCNKLVLTALPSGLTSIGTYAFYGDTAIKTMWIPSSCVTITATSATSAPFCNCSALTDIYCEAAEKPSGWGAYWNYISSSAQATVHWGVTKEAYDALIAGGSIA